MRITVNGLMEKLFPSGDYTLWFQTKAKKLAREYAKMKVEEALKLAGDLMFEPHMTTLSREDFMNLKDKIEFE